LPLLPAASWSCRSTPQARDGLGQHRRERRLPRAQRTVRRIVILGHTGHLSLEAIRWCADTGIVLTQLDTDGRLLLTAGGAQFDDPRLRRAQAAAATNPVGVQVARALLTAKLQGQASVADSLGASPAATLIRRLAEQLGQAQDLPGLRGVEAQASNTYSRLGPPTPTAVSRNVTATGCPSTGSTSAPAPAPSNRAAAPRGWRPTPSTLC